jgi:hypothetical protein
MLSLLIGREGWDTRSPHLPCFLNVLKKLERKKRKEREVELINASPSFSRQFRLI